MDKKTSFKCNMEKPLNYFYKHSRMSDGHLNKCKDCTKNDVKIHTDKLREDLSWVEKERERGRGREKYYRLNYKEKSEIPNKN